MNGAKELLIVGAGGAGVDTLFVARRMGGWTVIGFADDAANLADQTVEGIPVLGAIAAVAESYKGRDLHVHCAIGNNRTRAKLAGVFEKNGFPLATLIDPSAIVAPSARVGAGSYLGAQVFVGPLAQVGQQVLANVGASIGHHCVVGDNAQLSPGSRISGYGQLGMGSFMGSNGVIAPGIRVG